MKRYQTYAVKFKYQFSPAAAFFSLLIATCRSKHIKAKKTTGDDNKDRGWTPAAVLSMLLTRAQKMNICAATC